MNLIPRLPRLICLMPALLFAVCQSTTWAQDISGGAAITLPRHENPTVRPHTRKKVQGTTAGLIPPQGGGNNSASSPPSPAESQPNPPSDKSRADLKDETEDALALGNSARDANPPRYEDAERAYRLAAKLSPRDPRPHLGLGNIYYDQKRYADAALHYRKAIELQQGRAGLGVVVGGIVGGGQSAAIGAAIGTGVTPHAADLHAYAGEALVRQQKWVEAETELRKAIEYRALDGGYYALLGHAQFEQKKYPEAIASYKKAVELEPQNATYKDLLEKARAGNPSNRQ